MTRAQLEEALRPIAKALDESLKNDNAGERVGFVLMFFDFGEGGWFTYASNGTRADVVRLLKEARDKIGASAQ